MQRMMIMVMRKLLRLGARRGMSAGTGRLPSGPGDGAPGKKARAPGSAGNVTRALRVLRRFGRF